MELRDENVAYLQPAVGRPRFGWLKWTLAGCGGMILLAVGSCTAGTWYLGYQGKKAFQEYRASREDARAAMQEQKDPEKIPDWVPIYPGAAPQDGFLAGKKDTGNGFFRLNLPGDAHAAAKFFHKSLTAGGFSVGESSTGGSDGTALQIAATDPESSRVLSISLATRSGKTSAVVRYQW